MHFYLKQQQIINKKKTSIVKVSYSAACRKHQVSTPYCSSPTLPHQAPLPVLDHPVSWPCRCSRLDRDQQRFLKSISLCQGCQSLGQVQTSGYL
uniref:Uncharacterized protein n=1 Tax=Zea mays TaxID=4577 RepID=C4J6B6_MAIZE|nr:unknown [Zea mays]